MQQLKSNMPYVAAGKRRKGKDMVFHVEGCHFIARMATLRRYYPNRQDAIADGGRSCMVCKP